MGVEEGEKRTDEAQNPQQSNRGEIGGPNNLGAGKEVEDGWVEAADDHRGDAKVVDGKCNVVDLLASVGTQRVIDARPTEHDQTTELKDAEDEVVLRPVQPKVEQHVNREDQHDAEANQVNPDVAGVVVNGKDALQTLLCRVAASVVAKDKRVPLQPFWDAAEIVQRQIGTSGPDGWRLRKSRFCLLNQL